MDTKILIVDDEPEIVAFTKDYLQDQGYQVITAYNGQEALRSLQRQPNMIILDIMMPGMDGFELCELVRKRVTCPIIFLSAKHSEEDRIRGLMVGGDDYLTKPFSLKELHARIIAHLRREHRLAEETKKCLYFGNLMIDLEGYEVYYLNERLSFTSKEFEMIQFLALHPGQVFSRESMYERIWGYDAEGDSSTITEHIKKIRSKLAKHDPDQSYISTVWGVGYKWEK
ncbi:response regulator transcription factor [Heyndrickxia oleronia]|jgi:DNA-binding response OmpR family regulator|uniref:response regulator transcription factor n=1 Tax=Heyndrickxia oleronia TaxID=38875 RepID=UPI0009039B04|nr:response regulator transcription factor [Heyndrickxia oleronia]NYV68043.1 response regulator transcription factor [Bacillus sp. Gen3]OJH19726.1 DNA-binding response regulator [Bacillus obstructivus]MBU5212315.1 response regulator transcription factor [Heyndrickxia oleronia]MCI1589393.1 response regulator transcription factor [Heyndrickxia oleronia]MCI1612623.1 response regulator transcription factor [Heyndrickxia oleronia]